MRIIIALVFSLSILNSVWAEERATRSLTVRWGEIEGAEKYELEVSTSRAMDPIIERKTVKSTESLVKLPAGEYFYRVRGVTADGEHGPWSDTQQFALREKKKVAKAVVDSKPIDPPAPTPSPSPSPVPTPTPTPIPVPEVASLTSLKNLSVSAIFGSHDWQGRFPDTQAALSSRSRSTGVQVDYSYESSAQDASQAWTLNPSIRGSYESEKIITTQTSSWEVLGSVGLRRIISDLRVVPSFDLGVHSQPFMRVSGGTSRDVGVVSVVRFKSGLSQTVAIRPWSRTEIIGRTWIHWSAGGSNADTSAPLSISTEFGGLVAVTRDLSKSLVLKAVGGASKSELSWKAMDSSLPDNSVVLTKLWVNLGVGWRF